jgi:Uma2 family endonuclease
LGYDCDDDTLSTNGGRNEFGQEKSMSSTLETDDLVRRFSLAEFAEIANSLPDDRLELINGEIVMTPPPNDMHINLTIRIESLLNAHYQQILAMGCSAVGSSVWYAVPVGMREAWVDARVQGPHHVCPDVSVCYTDYLDEKRVPPALLIVEVLSVSQRSAIDRDLINKPDIYAALRIPAYWVVDRRDGTVLVHTDPIEGQYTRRTKYRSGESLPAPGLEFLTITPAQIFAR